MSSRNWTNICNEFNACRSQFEFLVILNMFKNRETMSEKVELLYELYREDNIFQKFESKPNKSISLAAKYRKEGNYAFCHKQYADAMKLYTESIAAAPFDSDELALAYSNRSAALFRLGKFALALVDVNRSLKLKHPEFLQTKLQRRKSECIVKIRSENADEASLLRSFSVLSLGDVDPSPEADFDEDISDVNYDAKFSLSFPDFKNELIPNSSEKIKLHETEEMGRHLVATEDIMPGELLMYAEPFVMTLFPEFFHTYCSHCVSRCDILIPCEGCTLVMFCGERCKNESLQSYHRMECQFLSFFLTLERCKVELLTLRLLMKITKQGTELRHMMAHPILRDPTAGRNVNVNEVFRRDDSIVIHSLMDNFDGMPEMEKLERCAMAAMLLHILKQSTYFDEAYKNSSIPAGDSRTELTEVECFVGALLLKYLCLVGCNSHYIGPDASLKTVVSKNVLQTTSISIGGAIYPSACFINHSCDPNVYHPPGKHIFLYSIQPVSAGQQIFHNYGANYVAETRSERQFFLKDQYYFKCKCDACNFDWPLYRNLPRKNPKYLSKRTDTEELKASSKRFNALHLKSVCSVNVMEEWEFFRNHLTLLHRNIQKPWGEYVDCQEILKRLISWKSKSVHKRPCF